MRKDYAQTAEGLGYDYLLVYDHVPGAHPERERKLTGPYTHEHPFHEGGAGGHQRFWRGRGDLDMTAPYRTPLAAAIGAVGTAAQFTCRVRVGATRHYFGLRWAPTEA